jgi:hypothetical protein
MEKMHSASKRLFSVLIVSAVAGLNSWSSATPIITLTDNNSIARIDAGSQAGMFYWALQDSPSTFQNQLNQQWFWYRIGSTGPENSIDTISAPVISGQTANTVTTKYTGSGFDVAVKYSLVGGAPGSGTADIAEQITINNTSGAVLPFHFFQYSDFNLAGDGANDFVLLSQNGLTMRFNQSDQVDGANIVETVITPNANHGEADFVPVTLNKLNDGASTTLNDANTSAGPGDVAWAFQWDVNIGVGGSFIISKDKHLDSTFVPEPTLFALALPGAIVFSLRRRRAL